MSTVGRQLYYTKNCLLYYTKNCLSFIILFIVSPKASFGLVLSSLTLMNLIQTLIHPYVPPFPHKLSTLYSVLEYFFYSVHHSNTHACCVLFQSPSLDPTKVSMLLICLLQLFTPVTYSMDPMKYGTQSLLYFRNLLFNNSVAKVSKRRKSIMSSFNALHPHQHKALTYWAFI